MNKANIIEALKSIKYPGLSRDIISFGMVRDVNVSGDNVTVHLSVTTADQNVPGKIKNEVKNLLLSMGGINRADVQMDVQAPKSPDSRTEGSPFNQRQIPGVKSIVAVASGKGGVGKSTFSVNLACALEQTLSDMGNPEKVGIMDCDIYGPSVPLMIGLSGRPDVSDNKIMPLKNFGVSVMSMGLLVDEDAPVIWRGPMVAKAIQQFIDHVAWGELDVLIVDLPPGTGDAQLSLVQNLPLNGAIIVTTPQIASVNVAQRGARMFDQVNVPVLGVAENMSYLIDTSSGQKQYLFGQGGGQRTARHLQTDLLGQVPLDSSISIGGDNGIPVVISNPDDVSAQVFRSIADDILKKLS